MDGLKGNVWLKPACCTHSYLPTRTWLPGDSCTNYRKQVEWKKMNYVNLQSLRILLEPLGILINKNKPRIFLHWKAIKRWRIICYSLRIARKHLLTCFYFLFILLHIITCPCMCVIYYCRLLAGNSHFVDWRGSIML